MEKPSVCTLDCPDTCSLMATVEDGRITKLRGSHANPFTGGVLCNKVTRHTVDWIYSPERLMTPLARTGPKGAGTGTAGFEPIGWPEALDRVHDGFSRIIAQHGPQAIVPLKYAGPHGYLGGGSMDMRFFHKLGASLVHRSSMCGGVRSEAYSGTFGKVPGINPEQVVDAKLIVVWGNNVTWSNLHLMPLINEAKKKGARLVVVDPKRTKVAQQAHLHLAVLPGTDVLLGWAIAAELERMDALDRDFITEHVHGFEEFMQPARALSLEDAARRCGLTVEDIRQFARWYAELSPAAISIGNGLERNRNGGSGIRTVMALPALAGKFGVRGGGLVNASGSAFPSTPDKLTRPDLVPEGTRELNLIDLGRHLEQDDLDPPLRGVFIHNHNPLVVHPNQNQMRKALARDELFIVGCDVVMTDSLQYADVILPAASHLEYADLYPAYGQQWLQRAEPVIPPVGESLPNTEIFRRLAARFGMDDPCFAADDAALMDDSIDGIDPKLRGTRPSQISLEKAIPMQVDGEEPMLFHNVNPKTPSGKIELQSDTLGISRGLPLPRYQELDQELESRFPLALITPASDKRITSTFGNLPPSANTPALEMHPDDATARGLRDGSRVKVWNDLGEVHLPLKITDTIRPGVVWSEKGAWMKTSDNGQTVSALAPTHHADLALGGCYNDARVEVEAL